MTRQEELFAELFSDLPRLAPGGDEYTRRGLKLVKGLPEKALIADVGCGLGGSSLVLAEGTDGRIVALDSHRPYLESLSRRALERGLGGRIRVECGDMANLPFEKESLDLLWAEGAIYIIGFERGLRLWKPFLKPGAWIAVTELTWLSKHPPAEAVRFWEAGYPAMTTVEHNLETLRRHGYEPSEHFVLPPESWEREYYEPLERRLRSFGKEHVGDADAMEIIAAVREEIDIFRASRGSYSYVFYLARRKAED